jgi:hypothetical protein
MTTPITGVVPPPPKQIRFVNNQGQPPSKRRRINAAYVSLHPPACPQSPSSLPTLHARPRAYSGCPGM